MAISLYWTPLVPKLPNRLGKIPAETANHGDHALFDRPRANVSDDPHWLGKILGETANNGVHAFLIMIVPKRATGAEKFEAETVYHGDFEEQRRSERKANPLPGFDRVNRAEGEQGIAFIPLVPIDLRT